MAYDRIKEQTVVISKDAHTKLKEIAQSDKRSLRSALELLIEKDYESKTK